MKIKHFAFHGALHGALLAALACGYSASAQKGKPLFPDQPGMVSYTFRTSLSKNTAATLDTIKALKITDMEFSSLFGKTAPELRKLLDERGIKCSSFGVSYDDALNKTQEVGNLTVRCTYKSCGALHLQILRCAAPTILAVRCTSGYVQFSAIFYKYYGALRLNEKVQSTVIFVDITVGNL